MRDRIGRDSWHLNIEFKLKCAVGLLGHFAGTFVRHHISLGLPIVVDSSSLPYLLTLLCMLASASAKRQLLLTKCAIYILDFASDIQSPAESSKHRPNHHTCNIASLRNGDADYKADVSCCGLRVLLGQRFYTLPNIPGIHNNKASLVVHAHLKRAVQAPKYI